MENKTAEEIWLANVRLVDKFINDVIDLLEEDALLVVPWLTDRIGEVGQTIHVAEEMIVIVHQNENKSHDFLLNDNKESILKLHLQFKKNGKAEAYLVGQGDLGGQYAQRLIPTTKTKLFSVEEINLSDF